MTRTSRERRLDRIEERVEQLGDDTLTTDTAVHWREAAPEARPTGMAWDADEHRLTYDFWAAQWAAVDALAEDVADLVGFVAGYRSGKSILGARWVISNALRFPGTRHLVVGVDFTKAQGATYRVLFEQLPGEQTALVTSGFNGPEGSPLVEDYNRTRHTLTLTNGSVIVLGAGDRWSRHAGDEFASIWADEVAHYEESVHDILEMLGSRLTSDVGPNRQLWTTTGAGFNDVYDILEKQVDEDGDALGLNIELVRASVLDNPYLDAATRERLERQYAGTGREEQALHGGFAAQTGLVYRNFSRDVHVIEPDEAADLVDDGDDRRWYGYDAGWDDPRVVLEAGMSPMDQLVILDEFYREGTHVEDAIEWLKVGGKPRGQVFAEHEPSDIRKFDDAGWRARKAEKSIDAGIDEVRHRLEPDDEDRPGLLISADCEHLVRELLNYQREQVGTSGAVDHGCDALRYLVMGVEHGTGGEWSRSKHKLGEIA